MGRREEIIFWSADGRALIEYRDIRTDDKQIENIIYGMLVEKKKRKEKRSQNANNFEREVATGGTEIRLSDCFGFASAYPFTPMGTAGTKILQALLLEVFRICMRDEGEKRVQEKTMPTKCTTFRVFFSRQGYPAGVF